jgi:signal transduction histidine kinase
VGVAILRFRLFDMELVVRRAFVFGVLAAFTTVVYVVVVIAIPTLILGPSEVSGFGLLPFVAAAVIAIAFQPVRGWARRLAARTVYGERATPYEVMSELAERMGESFGEDDLLPRIARAIGEGTRAERADVWLRVGTQLRHAANWPGDQGDGSMIPLTGEELPDGIPGDTAVPVIDRGEILGALSLSEAPGEAVSDAERRLLDGVASQAGVALRNIRLTEELRDNLAQLMASRQRLVTAQDEQRRKLERDIHDGAQQQLVAMSVKAKLAETMMERDPDVARRIVGELRTESQEALESLRDLARGIYPPLLADEGIAAALEAQARRSSVEVTVRAESIGRESQEVEAAVYFCCLEALQNIAKYANARSAEVVLTRSDGVLRFEVRDDGVGFDPETTKRGTGLQNMADRVEALGGRVEVRTDVGAGTTVVGTIPVASGSTG